MHVEFEQQQTATKYDVFRFGNDARRWEFFKTKHEIFDSENNFSTKKNIFVFAMEAAVFGVDFAILSKTNKQNVSFCKQINEINNQQLASAHQAHQVLHRTIENYSKTINEME